MLEFFFVISNQSSTSNMTARNFLRNACLLLLVWVYVEAGTNLAARIDEVVKNDTSLLVYANCFLEKGPCPGEARVIKRLIPEFVYTSCGRCSERQKHISCSVVSRLMEEKFSNVWDEFLIKYDPEEIYRANLTTYMNTCTV